jgi:peroxiredoxin
MTIEIGYRIPKETLRTTTKNDIEEVTTSEIFRGKTVVLFTMLGAFTPTCSAQQLPGYLANAIAIKAIKAKGMALIACLSVNDTFVMNA